LVGAADPLGVARLDGIIGGNGGGGTPRAVVAIPVKDEAERIGGCLAALAAQEGAPGFAVLLLLNDCTDDSAAIARRLLPSLPFALHLLEHRLPEGRRHAGWARRLAMDAAADLLADVPPHEAVILTTDADCRVAPDWVAVNLRELAAGVELVAGQMEVDAAEAARLPPALTWRGGLEWRYEALLAELCARLDPLPHDPWPCHQATAGASLALDLATYRRIGGLPPLPLGEDRALAAAVARMDGRIRHSPDAKVTVSLRLDGRAEGGMASAIRHRAALPDSECDEFLEPLDTAIRRAGWRATLRASHALHGRLGGDSDWVKRLRLAPAAAAAAADAGCFGEAWALIEAASPLLARHPLRPSQLAAEIERAAAVVESLRPAWSMPPLLDREPVPA
jgi:hypothetical protein